MTNKHALLLWFLILIEFYEDNDYIFSKLDLLSLLLYHEHNIISINGIRAFIVIIMLCVF